MGRDKFEEEVTRIVAELRAMEPGSSVHIRETPDGFEKLWPNAYHKPIRVLHSARLHYLKHPWIADNEDAIVRAMLDPDLIRRDAKKPGEKVVFYRATRGDRHILVVVEQKPAGNLSNRVVTAFDALPREVERRKRLETLVWEK